MSSERGSMGRFTQPWVISGIPVHSDMGKVLTLYSDNEFKQNGVTSSDLAPIEVVVFDELRSEMCFVTGTTQTTF